MKHKKTSKDKNTSIDFDYNYWFSKPDVSIFRTKVGLSSEIVKTIATLKKEPQWMCDLRLKSYKHFKKATMPNWGADLSQIDFDKITYFARSTENQLKSWEELPKEIKDTYDKIGVPAAEKNFLAGVSAQYDSEVVYESVQKELNKIGVIFF